jgi:protein-L-isoaspartate(D-aspartate) O-methyltransferase
VDLSAKRDRLLQHLVRQMGTSDAIAAAFLKVPREEFVGEANKGMAYDDTALPIGFGATISQPSMLAIFLEELELQPGTTVLEVGSGSGYLLALMEELGAIATGVEIVPALADQSAERLKRLGYSATVVSANAADFERDSRFDRVAFSAAVDAVPEWATSRLTIEGFVLAPVGPPDGQELLRVTRQVTLRTGKLCRFVRFID